MTPALAGVCILGVALRAWNSRLTAWAAGLIGLLSAASIAQAQPKPSDAVFARVGEVVITRQAYDEAYASAARSKFYHGKPPEAEVARLQREVGDTLVNDVLLLAEAKRRKLQPDHADIAKQIDAYEAKYRNSPMWQSNKAKLLPPLKKKLEEQSVIAQLRETVRKVPEPTERQVQAYYETHKDKFTEPEQVKVAMILLKVDPSSPKSKWDAAIAEGGAIAKRLRTGSDFSSLARVHSGDESAKKGGDMGYLHRGMLPEAAQEALDKMQAGTISDPVRLLEGVAVFRLDDRKLSKLNPLAAVRERAGDLLQRDLGDQAWTDLLARLRKATPTKIDETHFLPLGAPVATAKPNSK